MKRIFLLYIIVHLVTNAFSQCANPVNIYSFTYNGKQYEIVKELRLWSYAASCADQRGGHLVEINDAAENTAMYNAIIYGAQISPTYVTATGGVAYLWIGATDGGTEGVWLWDGDNDGVGTNFWNGQGANGSGNGSGVGGLYYNWGGTGAGTPQEPDNWGFGQDRAAIALGSWPNPGGGYLGSPGEWNDITDVTSNSLYYIIEYDCPTTTSSITTLVCDSFISPSGMVLTTTNIYQDTIQNAAGCDSIIIIDLTVGAPTASMISEFTCDTYTSPSGKIWTTSGTYLDTIVNSSGCDSIISIYLTVGYSTSSYINEVVCDSYTSPGGNTWTSSNTYTDIIQNSAGCDSIINIDLTILHSSINPVIQHIQSCDYYVAPSGNILTASGSYIDTIPNAIGCDSFNIINLTILPEPTGSISIFACDSYVSATGAVWTTSGNYIDSIPSPSGCDSIISVDLTILNSSTSTIYPVVCDSYTSPGGNILTLSGIYADTLTGYQGCDSIIIIDLTIINNTNPISETVCNSFTSPSGIVWTTSGTYTDTIPNPLGCDSIFTINLTVLNSTTGNIAEIACDSYTSPGGNVWTNTGTYFDTIPNSVGCDSIISIDLTILNSTIDTNVQYVQACEYYVSPGGSVWTTSGAYIDTIPNSVGCDSINSYFLTVFNNTLSTISELACDSFISPTGNVWTTTGTYIDTLQNFNGCDSIITINLSVGSNSAGTISEIACESYTSPGGNTWTQAGVYQDTITNTSGCDSVITIHLSIESVDTSITQLTNTLVSNDTVSSYQWLDCGANFAEVPGATNQSFTPLNSGFYAVELTTNACIDTSTCIEVITIGILSNNAENNEIRLYPNPASSLITIEYEPTGSNDYEIIDLLGKSVMKGMIFKGINEIDISELKADIYFIRIDGHVLKISKI